MRKKLILVAIIILAFIMRFWQLGNYPALNADEAAIGYNAYSLLQTGHDEHGNPWPIHFQSFNDYKPGLYFYLVLPFIKFLGLNVWSVRLPNAFIGVLTVVAVYLLIKELFLNLKYISIFKINLSLAEITALFLAISPWHIHFSRGGWEVNSATFFITLGLLFFLKSLKKPQSFVVSLLSFIAALYTYHSALVIVPFITFGLLIIYRKDLKVYLKIKKVFITGLIGLIFLVPLGYDLVKGRVFTRASGVGIFADPGTIERINEQRGEHQNLQGTVTRIFHNKLLNYTLLFLDNWSRHFHGEFLFLSGDEIQRNRVPETGQMYLIDILFLVVGIFLVINEIANRQTKQQSEKSWMLVVWWLLIAPTAAAFTFQSPHALRAHNMIIPLIIISAYGFFRILEFVKIHSKYTSYLGYLSLLLLIAWSFYRYQLMYWLHLSKEYPYSSQYGVKELVNYVKENNKKDERVVVTDKYDQPYILFLFYLKYPPEQYQKSHTLSIGDRYGFSTVREFDKYEFHKIDFESELKKDSNSIIVGTDEEIPNDAKIIEEIYGTNGYKYFQVVAN